MSFSHLDKQHEVRIAIVIEGRNKEMSKRNKTNSNIQFYIM
jgi:hypothetical protein